MYDKHIPIKILKYCNFMVANQMLIMIVGLPCAGKTTYIQKFTDFLVYDDFITSYNGDVILKLKEGNPNIIVADPRLCNIKTFNKYYNLFSKYVSDIEIHVLTTSSDVCIERNKIRKLDAKIDVSYDIFKLSELFNIDNYTKNYQCVIVAK
jgi:predicted kinase